MIRQYRPGRHTYTETPRGRLAVGTVPAGTICRPHGCKSNVEVLAWVPRDYSTYSRGRFATKRITGGHMALVRDLRNGRMFELSDVWLLDAETF